MKSITKIISIFLLTSTLGFVAAADWILYENDNCKISFPSKPGDDSTSVESAVGPLKLYMHMLELPENTKDSNLVYGLIETTYPKQFTENMDTATVRKFFDGAVSGGVANVKGKLISVKEISLKGVPGREMLVDYSNGMAVITMRMYLKGSTMFALQTIALTGKHKNAASKKFFNSFEIK